MIVSTISRKYLKLFFNALIHRRRVLPTIGIIADGLKRLKTDVFAAIADHREIQSSLNFPMDKNILRHLFIFCERS